MAHQSHSLPSGSPCNTAVAQWWLVDVMQRHQQQEGLSDHAVVQKLAPEAAAFPVKLRQWALALGAHTAYPDLWQRLRQHCRVLLVLGPLIALLLGVALGNSALMWQDDQTVSVPLALMTILVPHLILLCLWLASMVWPGRQHQGSGLSQALSAMGARFWRQPEQQRAWHAWWGLLRRNRLLKPLGSMLTHGFWLFVLVGALVTVAIRLALQEYHLVWPTTILSPAQLEQLAIWLGWLPALLGIELPPASALASSSGQSQAGYWLLAAIAVYGVLPRCLLWLGSWLWWRWRLRDLGPDLTQPATLTLRRRLQPAGGTAQVTDAERKAASRTRSSPRVQGQGSCWASLDLAPPDEVIKVLQPLTSARDMGCLADRQAREHVVQKLTQHPAARLLVVVHTNLTPDRGSQRYLLRLQQVSTELGVLLVAPAGAHKNQSPYWQEWLSQHHIPWWHDAQEAAVWLR